MTNDDVISYSLIENQFSSGEVLRFVRSHSRKCSSAGKSGGFGSSGSNGVTFSFVTTETLFFFKKKRDDDVSMTNQFLLLHLLSLTDRIVVRLASQARQAQTHLQ